MRIFAPVFLRYSIAVVVLWFGFSQLSDPASWLGFLPEWTSSLPISQIGLIYFNGWFEVVFGALLILGLYTRWVALFIGLHLLEITYTVGYDAIGVRDFGLAMAALSVFLYGADRWSLDRYFSRRM